PDLASSGMSKPYISNFDGLRAWAILPVMLDHASNGRLDGGAVGVDLFFTLSGYLITTLLIREFGEFGRISLPRFYIRPLLRLYPAWLTVTAATALLWNAFPQIEAADRFTAVFAPLLYWANLAPVQSLGPLTQCWSLSVEEHFYLMWPPILYFCLRRN